MYLIESVWRNMNSRCYSNSHSAYLECEVCEEWRTNYHAFAEWFVNNLYSCNGEQLELDKDLFSQGKKIYSPETCCLLPKRINIALAYRRKKIDVLPCGIRYSDSGRYIATIHRGNGHLIKTFDTLEEAVEFYRNNKERHIQELAKAYKPYLPERIYTALMQYKAV